MNPAKLARGREGRRKEGGKRAPWGASGRLWKHSVGLGAGGWEGGCEPRGLEGCAGPERVSYCLLFFGKGADSRQFLSSGSRRSGRAGASPPLRGAATSVGQSPGELPPATSRPGRRFPRCASRRLRLRLGLPPARPPVQPAAAAPRARREAPRDVSVGSFPPPALTPSASPPPARSPGQAQREGAGPRLHHSAPAAAQPEGAGGASERDASRSAPGPGETAVTLPGRHGGRAPLNKQNPEPLVVSGRRSPGHAARLLTARRGRPRGHLRQRLPPRPWSSPCVLHVAFLLSFSGSVAAALPIHPATLFFPIFTLPSPAPSPFPRLLCIHLPTPTPPPASIHWGYGRRRGIADCGPL